MLQQPHLPRLLLPRMCRPNRNPTTCLAIHLPQTHLLKRHLPQTRLLKRHLLKPTPSVRRPPRPRLLTISLALHLQLLPQRTHR